MIAKPLTTAAMVRIYPTAKQEVLLNKTFGCVRVVWSHNVEVFNKFEKNLIQQESSLTTTQLKQKHEWMNEVSYGICNYRRIKFW